MRNVSDEAFVAVAETGFVACFQPGEFPVEGCVEMLSRPAAERYAEHREDIRCPRVLGPADDGFDIFPRVVDQRQ